MLNTEQVKKIAEHMWPEAKLHGPSKCCRYIGVESDTFIPLGNEDNHLILKALGDECKKRELDIHIVGGELIIDHVDMISGEVEIDFRDEFNNESICLAYLAVMESK